MILAIDIGGSQFGLALAAPDGRIIKHIRHQTNDHADKRIDRIIAESKTLISQSPVSACGIGFGGPVNFDAQRIVNSTHVAGWDDCPLPEIVQQHLGLPAIIDNDANVGALGEFTFGAGKNSRHIIYYTVSTGIGGGIIINGEIYRGGNGYAGELGHVPILRDGPKCDCGNRGCLEALCSGTAIGRRATAAVKKHPRKGIAIARTANPITAKTLFDTARSGDPYAKALVNEICTDLGQGLAMAVNAFAPDVIVIGGGVSNAGRVLFEPLRRETRRFLMPVHHPHLKIAPAKLKSRSVLLGAVALTKQL